MTRLENLLEQVKGLYEEKLETRDEWADWIYPNHVVIVTNNALLVAERFGANSELSQVAAVLHDVADYKMARINPDHENESMNIARDLMKNCGYADDEILLVVDDAIRYHSCHGNERPSSLEGLVLATADSMAHLQTDFYIHATWAMGSSKSLDEVKVWALSKIERDLNNKIYFDDIREEVRADYEIIKALYSR